MDNAIPKAKTPWHLWVIGVVTLLWNAMGVLDFTMTTTRNETYLASFTPEQLDYFYSFPTWTIIAWGIAVIGAALGSILLLLRRKLAVTVLMISFLAMVVVTIQNYVLSEVSMTEIVGPEAAIMSAAVFVISALLVVYAMAQRNRGVLR